METLKLDGQIAELEEEERMLNKSRRGEATAVVFVTVVAKQDCEVEFQMTYRESPLLTRHAFGLLRRITVVSGASWTPHYELYATSSEGKPFPGVTPVYCANITQKTGEDWTDTMLTLSTANSALKTLTVPSLYLLKISPIATPQRTPRPSVLVCTSDSMRS